MDKFRHPKDRARRGKQFTVLIKKEKKKKKGRQKYMTLVEFNRSHREIIMSFFIVNKRNK